MSQSIQRLRTCERGHQYYKASDCPSCPVCEKENRPTDGFLSMVSAPVRRALLAEEIDSLKKLSEFSRKEILKLHGVGPAVMPRLAELLAEEGLSFRGE